MFGESPGTVPGFTPEDSYHPISENSKWYCKRDKEEAIDIMYD